MAYLDRLENARLLLFEVLLVTGELVLLSLQGRLCLLQPPDEPSNPFDSPAHAFFGSREARARCSGWGRKSESATRHGRHDTAPLAPYLKFDHFSRNSLFENEQFSTKICEIGAQSLFENWQFPKKFRENS